MREEIKTVYYCDFCSKRYLSKHFCGEHEKRCDKNPENDRACFGCIHLTMDNDALIVKDGYHGEEEWRVNAFHCTKLDKYLIPPKAEHKGIAYEFEDHENTPMPRECDLKKSEPFLMELRS